MSARPSLDDVLARAAQDDGVLVAKAPAPAVLARVQAQLALPPALAAFYARADGLEAPHLEVFGLDDLADVNADADLFAELPEVVFFGSDGGDGFFLLDPEETLGSGAETVFWADRGVLEPDACRIVAPDLATFLDGAVAGAAMDKGPEVGARSLDRLTETIARHPERVLAHPGLGNIGAMMAARRSDFPIPFGLSDFYARHDGLFVHGMRLRVFGIDQLGAIRGDEEVIALWIGEDAGGRRLGLTVGGWRGLPACRLFVVRDEQEVATAATLGRFTDVLRAWIEASAPRAATP
ncbi:MAG: SMI1/KNR4 family protein [Proteobacteria bacterium]|nr:SMI1/KNR4 family protein [Pseudomonadota bacterium]